jgi:hypothetical protein
MDSNAERGSLQTTSTRGGQRRPMRFAASLRDRPVTDHERQDCQWAWTDARVDAPQILHTSLCWTSHANGRCVVFGKHHVARSDTVRMFV